MNSREIVRNKMAEELTELSDGTFRNKNLEKIANNLEKSIFNSTIKNVKPEYRDWVHPIFVKTYSQTFRKVLFNLFKNSCSEIVRERIRNGHIKVTDIAFMTHQELNPGILMEATQIYERHLFTGTITETEKEMIKETTGMFRCGKCRSERTTYHTQQLRSADEPETVFVHCLMCDNRWRF